jgi:hypothetical protein
MTPRLCPAAGNQAVIQPTALAAAGLLAAYAFGAVLLYRIVAFKGVVTPGLVR